MFSRWAASVLVATGLVATAGCAADEPETAEPATTTTARSSPSTTAPATAGLSFSDDTERGPVDLGDGWSAARCEGDAPIFCVTRAGTTVGKVELAVFPVDSIELDGFADAVEEGDVEEAMTIVADDFVRALEADRKDGCGSDYELEPDHPEPATVLGKAGLRYGYTGTKGGETVERQVGHGLIDGDDVVLVNTPAYAPGGCVPPEGEFDLNTLEEFLPRLGGLIAASTR